MNSKDLKKEVHRAAIAVLNWIDDYQGVFHDQRLMEKYEYAVRAHERALILERITDYLSQGGLFNPDLMNHDMVRDLILDCRTFIEKENADGNV